VGVGPPSGVRLPDEAPDRCAARELFEETGLQLVLHRTDICAGDWLVYHAESPQDAAVTLSAEHDRFAWLSLDRALELVTPVVVNAQLAQAARLIS
jgi:8-oxo-dGTP pyrophosphatase MutT (NUDIX family)